MNVKAYDCRNRALCMVKPDEANTIVSYGFGLWTGKGKRTAADGKEKTYRKLKLSITKEQLISFMHMMRFEYRPIPRAEDNRTHGYIHGLGFYHIRNEAYSRIDPEPVQG